MGIQLRDAPALRAVVWRDLRTASMIQTIRGLLLTPPWFVFSLALADGGLPGPALLASAVFFMAGLRQAHDGFHRTLGLPRGADDGFLFLLSLSMAVPLHAVKFNHLRHHARPLAHDDVEGACAGLPWWLALASGPLFTVRMLCHAFAKARGRALAWMAAEAAALMAVVAVAVWSECFLLRYHLVVMALGNGLTGFFAVWLVHRGCDPSATYARTQRGWLVNTLTLNLLYHLEHHLFPAVPACRLPELARRIDAVLPAANALPVVGKAPNQALRQTGAARSLSKVRCCSSGPGC